MAVSDCATGQSAVWRASSRSARRCTSARNARARFTGSYVTVSDTRPWVWWPRPVRSGRDAFRAQLFFRRLGFLQIVHAHRTEDFRRLRELHLAVVDDLDLVPPRIVEVQATSR